MEHPSESDSASNSGFESDEITDMPEDEYDGEYSAVERYALNLLEEEARLEAARDKATSFYRRGDDRKRHTSTNPKCAASAEERRNECMLLRQPPPWHLLNTSTTRALFSSTSKPSISVATLDKSHDKPSGFTSTKPAAVNAKKAMKAKQALMDWDAQRRTLHSLRSTSTRQEGSATAGPSSSSTSRNPFARRFGDDGDGSPASGSCPSLLSVRPQSAFTSTRLMLGPNGAHETPSKPPPPPPSNSNKTSLKKASSHKQLARSSGSPRIPSTASIPSTPGIILKAVTTLSVPLPPSVNDVKAPKPRKETVVRETGIPGIPKELSSEENGQRSAKGKGKGTDLHAEMDATLARYSRRSSLLAYVGQEDMQCSGTDGPVKRLIIKADDPPPARPTKRAKKETPSSLDKAKKTVSRRESTQFDWKVWGMR
ncbi:hypothetical protein BDN71DRAFT_945554 [Pleurotus eryngii]|uniref:Uncharacterized protein n=1 Tax=Pleurotus eryngii TaxID=5323 RepID=A0A9P6A841_PLEER|nr:hypothetical protein BDN71DRAFT_945554 [Pleurotus eryngii]